MAEKTGHVKIMRKYILEILSKMSEVVPPNQLALYAAVAVERFPSANIEKALAQASLLDERQLQEGRQEIRRLRGQRPFDLATMPETEFQRTLGSLAADQDSLDILRCIAALRPLDLAKADNFEIALRLHGSVFNLQLPVRGGYGVLHEIVLTQIYGDAVDARGGDLAGIYDFGAHVGLSSIYLHSQHPGATLICVEPSKANVRFLSQNLSRNRVPHQIFAKALTNASGFVPLYLSASPSMLNSAVFDAGAYPPSMVESLTVWDLPRLEPYGIKLDIEGAEYMLCDSAPFLAGAEWIQGELHFGRFTRQQHRCLLAFLEEHFVVHAASPRLDCSTSNFLFAREFVAIRRRSDVSGGLSQADGA